MGLNTTFNPKRDLLNPNQLSSLQNVLAVPKSKLIYCYVPKVGCTSWKSLLLQMEGLNATRDPHKAGSAAFRSLSTFDSEGVRALFRTHRSFMFARNPFSRLLSAYRDKITLDNTSNWRWLLLAWLQKSDPVVAATYKAKFKNFTFTEFVKFYLSSQEKDEHWREMHKLCSPCLLHYDFIGAFETSEEETTHFLRSINVSMQLPRLQKKTNSSKPTELHEYYSQLPVDLLQKLVVDGGIVTDMKIFGYDVPEVIKELLP
ncbi:carbohydrate sulfotransferase 11-like [Diadema setosum]|uniref:carbohydrate sulfotransferase 11-like n=1 Tax=Diadema setosum TaxID=31175 RepID=UPI003B3BCF1B